MLTATNPVHTELTKESFSLLPALLIVTSIILNDAYIFISNDFYIMKT